MIDDPPASLEPGASGTVEITYEPLALETRSLATILFAGSSGAPADLALFGEPIAATAALVVAPSTIDFGYVPLRTMESGCATISDTGNVAVHIGGLQDFENPDSAFALGAPYLVPPSTPDFPAAPLTIPGGGSARMCFSFNPRIAQDYAGQVTLATDVSGGDNPVIQLTGWGGGPRIQCSPRSLAFGSVGDGQTSTLPVTCANVGSALPMTTLLLTQLPFVGGSSAFTARLDPAVNSYPPGGLAPGQSVQIDVTYSPTSPTQDLGTLIIENNGGLGNPIDIPVTGHGADD